MATAPFPLDPDEDPLAAGPGVPVLAALLVSDADPDETEDGAEPEPPAASESCANPTAGGLDALKTEYTFFYMRPGQHLTRAVGANAYQKRSADDPARRTAVLWDIAARGKVENSAKALAASRPVRPQVHVERV